MINYFLKVPGSFTLWWSQRALRDDDEGYALCFVHVKGVGSAGVRCANPLAATKV